ncbi:Multi antimicrobial extrusion (MATE) family-like protein [Sulfitobacter noctilucicola]|uniref:Putative MATE family efflux protein n=1 Tax=Sulfitobacter noctilucicola TaxID=1342301 RepID=A0A7W6M969_9RHOB|nr:MATE family efflux transporter [Sulfitobacter noctilucicola]KIN63787.1 Multi antimicrobial extrusion (MATE) family-like protein [Sulfitobacter noctilucicola]MBB4174704.1 putative MATE family efflux protein [Sulfitobacter noctilucicola]
MEQGRFLTGGTMGHVVRMTATGAMGITFVFLVDAANLFWVSQLGQPQLVAAIGFAYAVQFFSVSIAVGLMIGATAVISRSIGMGSRDQARRQAGAAAVIAASILACVSTLIVGFRHQLIGFTGAEGETARLAARYLAITIPSLIPMSAALVLSGTLRADGYGAKAMYITLTGGMLLMLIDPVLIFWMGWGLDGAAIGLVLFRFTLLVAAIYFAIIQMKLVDRPTLRTLRNIAGPFMAVAGPAIATQMSTPAGNYLLTIVMARYGDEAMAAWAVVGRLTVVVFGGVFALSGAIGGIFGQNFGAGQMDRVRSTYRDALMFCFAYTVVAWVLMLIATPYVIKAFALTGVGQDVLRSFTLVGVGGFIFIGALFVSNAAFNNLGKPGRSTLVNWSKDGILSFPAAAAFAGLFGASGVIYGQAAAGALMGIIAATWGWFYVNGLRGPDAAGLDPAPPRAYPNPDRHRRR